MDQDLQTYLHSLKQLYGLLFNDCSSSVSTMLDDNSRLLLKDWLDIAFENVINIDSKNGKNGEEMLNVQKLRSGKETLNVGISGSKDMHKYCRKCERPKPKLKSSASFSKSPSDSEESDGSIYHDCAPSGHESPDYLSKQASDAMKKIDMRMLDLQAAQNQVINELSTRVQELSERVNGRLVLQPEPAGNSADPHSVQHKDRRRLPDQHISEEYHQKTQRSNYVESPAIESDEYSESDESEESSCYESEESSGEGSEESSGDGSEESSGEESEDSSEGDGGDDGEVYSYRRSSDRHYVSTSRTSHERKMRPKMQRPRQARGFAVGSRSSKRMRPRRASASVQENPGKKIGRWKKLKGKIPHIFHHQKHTNVDHEGLISSENKKALPPKSSRRHSVEKTEKALVHGARKSANAMWGLVKHAARANRSKPSVKKFNPFLSRKLGKTKAKSKWLKILPLQKKAKKFGLGYRK